MKYLLLDTNIYLDMIVARTKSHRSASFNHMKKLLDYGETRLIVPSIVITEFRRHLNSEIHKIEESLKVIKKKMKDFYWINHVDEVDLFKERLEPVEKEIGKLILEFERNRERYKVGFKRLFDELFAHKNVIVVEATKDVLFKAKLRKLHKRRPFHYNQPTNYSLADAIKIETLINIRDYDQINIDREDEIYFISRNPKGFSSDANTERLHDEIITSMSSDNFIQQIYYSTLFTKTLLHEFREETAQARVLEELERELEEASYFTPLEERGMTGELSLLTSNWDMKIAEQSEVEDIIHLINEWKDKIIYKYEEYVSEYEDFLRKVCSKNLVQGKRMLRTYNLYINDTIEIHSFNDEQEIHDEIIDLLDTELDVIPEDFDLNATWKALDYFSLDEKILCLEDFEGRKYILKVEGKLEPSDGGKDYITLDLIETIDEKLISHGSIDIKYGYLDFDEEGNVADRQKEEIIVNFEELKDTLLNMFEKNYEIIETENSKIQSLKKQLGLWKNVI